MQKTSSRSLNGFLRLTLTLPYVLLIFSVCTNAKEETHAINWEEQVIYLVMVDRFNDGDSTNNIQDASIYDPSKESHYSGGDIQGVIDKLGYVKALGATALWLTPVFPNQWWDQQQSYSGYHGYWPRGFRGVDEHYGSLDDYKRLSDAVHSEDMLLIKDIVVNHVGNYFYYDGNFDASSPEMNFKFVGNKLPNTRPTRWPFNQNNIHDPEQRSLDIFNWTPRISDYSDPSQEWTFQMSRLDDINTQNPIVVKEFKSIFKDWMKIANIDAFRVDTVKYVEHSFWNDFFHSEDGILQYAEQLGKNHFTAFGEVKEVSAPLNNSGELKLREYVEHQGKPGLPALINFPLQDEIRRVFASGAPTKWMSYRLTQQQNIYPDPLTTLNFIDNHDTPRIRSETSREGLFQSLVFLFTLPGIPTLYMGDEQELIDSRQAMFNGGYLADTSYFDIDSPGAELVKGLVKLRKSNPELMYGSLEILEDAFAPGVLAYSRSLKGESLIVLLNTADAQKVSFIPLNRRFKISEILYSFGGALKHQVFDEQFIKVTLPPRSAYVIRPEFSDDSSKSVLAGSGLEVTHISVNSQLKHQTSLLSVTGSNATPGAELKLTINDVPVRNASAKVDNEGNWKFSIPENDFGKTKKTLRVYDPKAQSVSTKHSYEINNKNPVFSSTSKDSTGDDVGIKGDCPVGYPQDSSFGSQMDIVGARVYGGGAKFNLEIKMAQVSNDWVPSNGFDHVAFSIFFDVNKNTGSKVLDELGASTPRDFRWDFGNTVYGWGNFMYKSKDKKTAKLNSAPSVDVNYATDTITLRYDFSQLGVDIVDNMKVYITTWDRAGEGALRHTTKEGGIWEFSSGKCKVPKIMDDVIVQLSN